MGGVGPETDICDHRAVRQNGQSTLCPASECPLVIPVVLAVLDMGSVDLLLPPRAPHAFPMTSRSRPVSTLPNQRPVGAWSSAYSLTFQTSPAWPVGGAFRASLIACPRHS